ncbi:MAG TPA: hypothetical protein VNC78_02045 [Actinomycetota bacterium]|nr:hypothetical protein [Actinomycetota bacterium]
MWDRLQATTPADEMAAFIATPSYDVDGLRFVRFKTAPATSDSPYGGVTAIYSNGSAYDVHLYPSRQAAAAEFRERLEGFGRWPEVQTINTYEPVERCFSARGFVYCFGIDDTRTIRSYVPSDLNDASMNALLLLRTARKHYYRSN